MKQGRQFENEKAYEKYVENLAKGLEMLNLLLEANLYFKESERGRDQFFQLVTNKMITIRDALKQIIVFYKDEDNIVQESTFFEYDFSFPIFDSNMHPILPEYKAGNANAEHIMDAKTHIKDFIDLLRIKIINKK
jgi:hypothetical protein